MDGKRKNMLEIIFKAREEKLASLNSEDKDFFKVHNIDRSARRNSLNTELEKIPKDLRKLKEIIIVKLDDYVETINRENWYLCKKYYLAGLKDGINLKEEPSKFDPRAYLTPARDLIKETVEHKIRDVFGSSNKA